MATAKPRGVVATDLQALKPALLEAARAAGQSPGAWLRQLVFRELADATATPEPDRALAAPADLPRVKTTLRFGSAVHARLDELAKREGITRAEWIARRVLDPSRPAGPTPDQLDALSRSTYQLAGIGRNLNQVARSLNAHPGATTRADRQAISDAVLAARAHVEVATAVVEQLGAPARQRKRSR